MKHEMRFRNIRNFIVFHVLKNKKIPKTMILKESKTVEFKESWRDNDFGNEKMTDKFYVRIKY